jgi:uncharacterized protein YggU (UPF0235/DUF167 family)
LADPRPQTGADHAALPFAAVAGGLRVRVKVTPKAGRNRVDGLAPEADGGVSLKVAVTAAPEDGKANAAVVALLAREWGVAKSTISVVLGAADRRKVLHLAGDPAALGRLLTGWLARQDRPGRGGTGRGGQEDQAGGRRQ